MKCSEYLDAAIKKSGVKNDNQLKDVLKWRSSKVHNYRHNKQFMDNEAAREIAELIEVPVLKIIADMEIMRAKNKEHKSAWLKLSKLTKHSGTASTNLLININLIITGSALYCILCKIAKYDNFDKRELIQSKFISA
jgi:hypothetical protein